MATTYHDAVLDGDRDALYRLIFEDGGAGVSRPNDAGNPPVHAAAFAGDIEALCLLVRAGADPRALGAKGRSILHVASASNHANIVELALRSGWTDPRLADANGRTARDLASEASACAALLDDWLLNAWRDFLGTRDRTVDFDDSTEIGHISIESMNPATPLRHVDPADPQVSQLLNLLERWSTSPRATRPPTIERSSSPRSTAISPVVSPVLSFNNVDPLREPISLPTAVHLPNESLSAATENQLVFVVDGARVVVPAPTAAPKVASAAAFVPNNAGLEVSTKAVADVARDEASREESEDTKEEETVTLTIASALDSGSLGMLLVEDPREGDGGGVVVSRVVPGSRAHLGGIRRGDRVLSVEGRTMSELSCESVARALNEAKRRTPSFTVVVRRVRLPETLVRCLRDSEHGIDWSRAEPSSLTELVSVLEHPPLSCNAEEMLIALQSFQTAVALLRRGGGGQPLWDEARRLFGVADLSEALPDLAKRVVDAALTNVARAEQEAARDECDGDPQGGDTPATANEVREDDEDAAIRREFERLLQPG